MAVWDAGTGRLGGSSDGNSYPFTGTTHTLFPSSDFSSPACSFPITIVESKIAETMARVWLTLALLNTTASLNSIFGVLTLAERSLTARTAFNFRWKHTWRKKTAIGTASPFCLLSISAIWSSPGDFDHNDGWYRLGSF
ncbi:hypothetical protein BJ912DRAFT_1045667 [Pholiota molesta]|nr:hypothetical protein BJ912DRAFT_1045667 [Pholiota molesta]